MEIKKLTDFSKIETFLKDNFSSPTHWPDWNIVVSKHYNTVFFYLIAIENNQIVGICPIHVINKGILRIFYSGKLFFIPNGGWIFKEPINFQLSTFHYPLNCMFSLSSLPLLKDFKVSYLDKKSPKVATLIVNLSKTLEKIWLEDISGKRRNMIRKAEKNEVSVTKNLYPDLNIFYKYYYESNTSHNLGLHTIDFFRDLISSAQNIKFTFWFAHYKNKIIGSLVTVNDKNYSLYWLGLTFKGIENLGQGELLQWEVIKEMKANGCKYYDLCYIDKERLSHIYQFKHGFANNEVNIYSYQGKSLIYSIINKIQNSFNI